MEYRVYRDSSLGFAGRRHAASGSCRGRSGRAKFDRHRRVLDTGQVRAVRFGGWMAWMLDAEAALLPEITVTRHAYGGGCSGQWVAWRLGLAALVFFMAWPAPGAEDARRTSFLVILCDDLGYGDLGCYGHPVIKTPELDRLAAGGLRLSRCYSASPVCSPSRAGLLTGRNPNRLGIYDWIPPGQRLHLQAGEITIATLLRQAGYATCHSGKWHCTGPFNQPRIPQPKDHGFDHWFSTSNNAQPSHRNPGNFVRNGKPVGPLEGFACQLVADEAIAWLKTVPAGQPYFLFVCFHEPHEPIASPEDLVERYAADAVNRQQAEYFANVTNMDRATGRLLRAVEELGRADETLVLFTSDNGPETLRRYRGAERSYGVSGPLRGQKLHLYEGGIRVPGILRRPGRTPVGAVSDEPVCSLDLLPTFCRIAGIRPPHDRPLDGADFTPLLEGKPVVRDTPLFWFYYRGMSRPKAALMDGPWKVLAGWDGGSLTAGGSLRPGDQARIRQAGLKDFELYHLGEDIAERHDRAADEPERLERMRDQLRRRHAEVVREGPDWEDSKPGQ